MASQLLHQKQLRCRAHTHTTPVHLQGVRQGSLEQAQANRPSRPLLQQPDDGDAPPGLERGPGRRKKRSTSTEAPAGRQPSAGRATAGSGGPPSAIASATTPANSQSAAGKGKAGKGRNAAGKGPAADAAAALAGADMGAGSGGATADSAVPSGQQGRPKQARVLKVQRPAGPASAEPAGSSRTGEAVGAKSKKGSRQRSEQEVAADGPPPGIPTLPNGRPASAESPGRY